MNVKKTQKTILVSPIEWGLGHAVRLVPVIRACLARGWKVVIAADGLPLNFLRSSFPGLLWEHLPFTTITYSDNSKFIRKLISQLPGIFAAVGRNRHQIKALVEKHGVDAIISDHRYGLDYRGIPSVFITNQLRLIVPGVWRFAEPIVCLIHKWFIRNYRFWWFADFPGEVNFTGRQTHLPGRNSKSRFIGPVSRFMGHKWGQIKSSHSPEILVILSGPEPQRGILEKMLSDILYKSGQESVILRGLPALPGDRLPAPLRNNNILWFDHVDDQKMAGLILSAEKIICRPGLSMLSDLAVLGKTALIVPTPGQTEQNYMAKRLSEQKYFYMVKQDELTEDKIKMFVPRDYKSFPKVEYQGLNDALDELFP